VFYKKLFIFLKILTTAFIHNFLHLFSPIKKTKRKEKLPHENDFSFNSILKKTAIKIQVFWLSLQAKKLAL
jgi:hypothetical protein